MNVWLYLCISLYTHVCMVVLVYTYTYVCMYLVDSSECMYAMNACMNM